MSEAEKKKRADYRKKRAAAIAAITVVLAICCFLTGAAFGVFQSLNKAHYISYTEHGSVAHRVLFKNSDFSEGLEDDADAYVSSLVKSVITTFEYEMDMEGDDVEYKYTYGVFATVKVTDDRTDTVIYSPAKELVPEKSYTAKSDKKLVISQPVMVSYDEYNKIAKDFIEALDVEDEPLSCVLEISMNVNVISASDRFVSDSSNTYSSTLRVSLCEAITNIQSEATVPSDSKVLASSDSASGIFGILSIVLGGVDILILAALVIFVYKTRNKDINYQIKVKRLVQSYKSYIQKINNPFDESGKQTLSVATFGEMLELRDTLSSPILMYENEDRTCTKFIIPTATDIIYVFEIKVEDYDELYGLTPTAEPFEMEEEPIAVAAIAPLTEAVAEPEEKAPEAVKPEPTKPEAVMPSAIDEGHFRIIMSEPVKRLYETVKPAEAQKPQEPVSVAEAPVAAEAEELVPDEIITESSAETTKYSFDKHSDYSFEARLSLSNELTRFAYAKISVFVRSYGVKLSRSWRGERIYSGRKTLAVMFFKGSKLSLAFALNPADYEGTKYHLTDTSESKRFEKTPALLKITSARKVHYATELLEALFVNEGIPNKKLEIAPIKIPARTKKTLIKNNLIKNK